MAWRRGQAYGQDLRERVAGAADLSVRAVATRFIELAFSKPKRLLRAAAARTADALWTAIGAALNQFTADECSNYLRHCGYAQSGR